MTVSVIIIKYGRNVIQYYNRCFLLLVYGMILIKVNKYKDQMIMIIIIS